MFLAKTLTVRCVVESISTLVGQASASSTPITVPEKESLVTIPVGTAFQYLVPVALQSLKYPQEDIDAAQG